MVGPPIFFRWRENSYINLSDLSDVRSVTFVTLPPDDDLGTRAYVNVHNETIRVSDAAAAAALHRWIDSHTVNSCSTPPAAASAPGTSS
jgi:hypothetical protein